MRSAVGGHEEHMSISNHVRNPRRTAQHRRWFRQAAAIAVVATLAAACSSSADEVPTTTLNGSAATTLSPEAEGPQVGLEPGSNMPPDVNSTDPSSGDDDVSPNTSTPGVVGG